MLLAGDELGRTQRGNNNAYCQDNEISWVDWEAAGKHADLLEFTRMLAELRRAHRCSGGAGSSAASRDGRRRRAARHHLAGARRASEMTDARLAATARPSRVGVFLNGARHHRARPARRAGPRRQLPAAVQRPAPSR